MAIVYVVYEIRDHQPVVIGIFEKKLPVNALLRKLKREFPHLNEVEFQTRFKTGYILNPVFRNGKINYGGEFHELNPHVVRLQDASIDI